MVNRYRGEISAVLGGEKRTLCLTLGALAELEDAYGGEDLFSLATRFENSNLRASDIIKIIGAGLRGAGADITDVEIATFVDADGVVGYIKIISELLKATFTHLESEEKTINLAQVNTEKNSVGQNSAGQNYPENNDAGRNIGGNNSAQNHNQQSTSQNMEK